MQMQKASEAMALAGASRIMKRKSIEDLFINSFPVSVVSVIPSTDLQDPHLFV